MTFNTKKTLLETKLQGREPQKSTTNFTPIDTY